MRESKPTQKEGTRVVQCNLEVQLRLSVSLLRPREKEPRLLAETVRKASKSLTLWLQLVALEVSIGAGSHTRVWRARFQRQSRCESQTGD